MRVGIIGTQVGDEGKAKVLTSFLSEASRSAVHGGGGKPILTERFQGGGNAGHTIVVDGEQYALHQVPSGIVYPDTFNLMGHGMFGDPTKLVEEIKGLERKGVSITPNNFGIDSKMHMTLLQHVCGDRAGFEDKKTTGSGIKQTAVDKYGRVGIRFNEFLDRRLMDEIVRERFGDYAPMRVGKDEFIHLSQLAERYDAEREFLSDFVTQTHEVRKDHGHHFHFFEGAQGARLDVDVGQYPHVTSSNPLFVPGRPDLIVGVAKMYESSVGRNGRAFVGEMESGLADRVREEWGEFGTTTGNPRDLGWFDALGVRYAVENGQVDYLAMTCGDRLEVLHDLGENIKLVVGYEIDGVRHDSWDASFDKRDTLDRARPIFEEFEPWERFEVDGRLTDNARRYVDRIQELLDTEIIMYGTGPCEDDMVVERDILSA